MKPNMRIVDLTGVWTLSCPGRDDIAGLEVVVPGGVHPALMEAGLIPDPGVGGIAAEVTWVGERDWVFERPFEVDEALLAHDIVDIEFDGIDTVAEVFVNDAPVLKVDNMFHRWRADVKGVLRPGENRVRVAIAAPGFSADCLETCEELAIRGREQFIAAGGSEFATLECLNDGEAGMAMLETLVRRELMGWV